MTTPRFLQIHTLHAYPGVLLNRDDSGLAKRLPFGGVTRTRISSQSLKRHWRVAEDMKSLANIPGATEAVRSREIVSRRVIEPLKANGAAVEVLKAIEPAFQKAVYGDKGEQKKSRQPLLLGQPEIDYLAREAARIVAECGDDAKAAAEAVKELEKTTRANLKAMRAATALPGGLVSALFGRMVTSDVEANIDAAIHVAHAFTVHGEESESDYFSVVDDLHRAEDDAGADHIGDVELTTGLYYGYVVIDVPALVHNLAAVPAADWLAEGMDRTMAGQVVDHLLHLIATVTPGAKKGSTAPYSFAEFMLVEAGERQPRTLANAFRTPVSLNGRNDVLENAIEKLDAHLSAMDECYGPHEARCVAMLGGDAPAGAVRLNLPGLASWAAEAVTAGQVDGAAA